MAKKALTLHKPAARQICRDGGRSKKLKPLDVLEEKTPSVEEATNVDGLTYQSDCRLCTGADRHVDIV